MQFIFVEFWVTVDFTRCGVNHRHWHFVFGIEVKQTNCTFQFNRYSSETSSILGERIENTSIAFLKCVSIYYYLKSQKKKKKTRPNRKKYINILTRRYSCHPTDKKYWQIMMRLGLLKSTRIAFTTSRV